MSDQTCAMLNRFCLHQLNPGHSNFVTGHNQAGQRKLKLNEKLMPFRHCSYNF